MSDTDRIPEYSAVLLEPDGRACSAWIPYVTPAMQCWTRDDIREYRLARTHRGVAVYERVFGPFQEPRWRPHPDRNRC